MHTINLRGIPCQLITKVKITSIFIIKINFISLGYVKALIIVNTMYIIHQKRLKLLGTKIQLSYSIITK